MRRAATSHRFGSRPLGHRTIRDATQQDAVGVVGTRRHHCGRGGDRDDRNRARFEGDPAEEHRQHGRQHADGLPGCHVHGRRHLGTGTALTLTPEDADEILRGSVPPSRDVAPASAPARRSSTAIATGFLTRSRARRPRISSCATGKRWLAARCSRSACAATAIRCASSAARSARVFSQCLADRQGNPHQQRLLSRSLASCGRKGANMMGMDQDDIVLAPWTTIKYRVSGSTLTNTNQSAAPVAVLRASATRVNTSEQSLSHGDRISTSAAPRRDGQYPQPVRFANVDQIRSKQSPRPKVSKPSFRSADLLRERHRIRNRRG